VHEDDNSTEYHGQVRFRAASEWVDVSIGQTLQEASAAAAEAFCNYRDDDGRDPIMVRVIRHPSLMAYIDTVLCRFPGCQRPAQVSRREHTTGSLCFDHLELLFYEPDEFTRLWATLDTDHP
jgi:hypothetical protein